MIAHASHEETLLAGDVIGSGTVGTGCGLELDKWIKEGDEVELKVESIGSLKNVVGKKTQTLINLNFKLRNKRLINGKL